MRKPPNPKLRWGVLGCGKIARRLAQALRLSSTGVLVAAGSRTLAGARQFADEFKLPHAHGSYDELLANPAVDVVYIATPHPYHAAWAIRAAQAGKHILCEKPLTMNARDTATVVDAARTHDVFLLEAFMYRVHPLTALWMKLLREGEIGELKVIQSSFAFRADWLPQSRLLNPALGGGGILDVGGYPVSLARLAAGVALGLPFAEPLQVTGFAHFGKTGVDEFASAILQFPRDILAEVSCGVRLGRERTARFFGTEGRLEVADPFFCQSGVSLWKTGAKKPKVFKNPAPSADLYSFEVDAVAQHLAARQAPSPALSWDDSLGQACTLDRWLTAVGLQYPATPLPS
ncbi:MAG: Gfo/Idh/MocA family oxidoreductase [Opitutales bacterium]